MSGAHTSTPWSLGGKATIKAIGPYGGTEYIATLENNDRRAANAAFVVRAVNAHDDLVAALKEAHLQLVYLDSQFSTGTTPTVLARIHNALAKAAQS